MKKTGSVRLIVFVVFFFFVGCVHTPRKASIGASNDGITLTLSARGPASASDGTPSSTNASLSPVEDRAVYRADEEAIYALVTLQMARDIHTIRWKWIDPSGHIYIEPPPIDVGNTGDIYREIKAYHKINLKGDAAEQQSGTWQIQAIIEAVDSLGPATRIERSFQLDPVPQVLVELPPSVIVEPPIKGGPPEVTVPSEMVVPPEPPPAEVVPPPIIVDQPVPEETDDLSTATIGAAPRVGAIALLFKFGKATLTSASKQALVQQIDGLKAAKTILVRGYHDATGPVSFNRILARQRAEGVANFLMTQGIAPETIRVEVKAETYFAPNDTRENRQKNRQTTVEAIE